ncbi:MAG: fructooligosaccharide transport system permease protein [Candidatus Sumerlaeota bacterium]|nr:fructooligosaccharide transport system permease protein [Candidatus Sumerlaeota bacterium]
MARKHREHISIRQDLEAAPFLLPFMAVFVVFIGYPLFYSLFISLYRVTIYSDFYDLFGTMEFVGLGNYVRIFQDPVFLWSIFLTMVYALLMIAPGIAMSLALALMLNRKRRGFALLRSGFFLPNVFDIYVVGVIWLLIYNPKGGLFSVLLHWAGVHGLADSGVLNNPWLVLPAIALVMVLKNAGFGMILFLTSLNNISSSIFEAADVDGANPWQKLVHITIPMLKPTILFLSITGLVGSLNAFAEIYALTDDTGGTSVRVLDTTLQSGRISGYHLFKVFNESMYGEAAAISFVLLGIAIVVAFINFKVLSPKD